MSTEIRPSRPSHRKRSSKRKAIRRLVEFQGIRRLSLQQYRSHVRQLYDGPAGAVLALGSVVSLHEPLVGRVLRTRKFNVEGFHDILDIGSGAGQILGHLLKVSAPESRIVGTDLSWQMLKRARTRLKSTRPGLLAADMMRLPFRDESFDCVTCGWVIEHLPDPKPGHTEMGRMLRPGGSLLLLTTEDTFTGFMTSHTWKCRTYNRRELHQACEEVSLPWSEELWFTRVHRFFRLGGILVRMTKPQLELTPAPEAVAT